MSFPAFCKDKEFKHLMSIVLNKNPLARVYKLTQIKCHPWFADFNWVFYLKLKIIG